ncbi:MAG: hypothetical protein AAGD38_16155 [Acidobacteriota bacterium]
MAGDPMSVARQLITFDADRRRRLAWAVLLTLLAALGTAAVLDERPGVEPPVVAGESTYWMQAASLAHDFDLTYERRDIDRFLAHWRHNPVDLALVSGSRGEHITWDRPFLYALLLAPFVGIWPQTGFAVLNSLLLAFAALLAARVLSRRIGSTLAPILVSVFVFATVTFDYVFLLTGDLFLLVLSVIAFALMTSSQDLRTLADEAEKKAGRQKAAEKKKASRKRVANEVTEPVPLPSPSWRWLLAGGLLAVVVFTAPITFGLLVGGLVLAQPSRRFHLIAGFGAGAIAIIAVHALGAGGGVYGIGVERFRFRPATGYPLVDFTAAEFSRNVQHFSALYWDGAPRIGWGFDPLLWLWNGLYLLLGESIGLLPYFPALFLLFAGRGETRQRRALLIAAGLWVFAIFFWRPFDLFGGPAAVGNRLFLPLWGALWLAVPAIRHPARWLAPVLVLAILFLPAVWQAPGVPLIDNTQLRHPTATARALLPYETSQRTLPAGQEARLDEVWVRPLDEHVWSEEGQLKIDPGATADLLIAVSEDADLLRFDFGSSAPAELGELHGAELLERMFTAGGGVAFRVELPSFPPSHAMWWTPNRQRVYRIRFGLPAPADGGALAFDIVAERFLEE